MEGYSNSWRVYTIEKHTCKIFSMKIILLSGQSLQNKSWIEDVQKKFKEKYQDVEIMYYDHWNRGEGTADVEIETKKFLQLTNGLDDEYMLFAKSIGTVIFLNSLPKLQNHPKKVIMVGVPYEVATQKGYKFETLKDFVKCDVSLYQKSQDPMGSYDVVKTIEGGKVNVYYYECINEEDNTHHYSNMDTLMKLIS